VSDADQAAADETLRAAVIAHARAYDIGGRDDELLSDYVVVAHWQEVTDQGRSRYTIQYSTASIAAHIAFGLLTIGNELLRADNLGGDE
jgi:hypothetical protein